MQEKKIPIKDIFRLVCEEEGITYSMFIGPQRNVHIVRARDIARYLCARLSGKSLAAIGRMAGTDHSTVLYAVRKVNRLLQTDMALAEKIRKYELALSR